MSGVADYVLGYCHSATSGQQQALESIYIVIEAKRRETMAQGIIQGALYLAGIQQDRKRANKIVSTVYGVITDSVQYQFLRLDDEGSLFASKTYSTNFRDDKQEM